MDYLRYWSLLRKPFLNRENDRFFAGSTQREAIAGLSFFAASNLSLACLISPGRCGATRLLQHVRSMRGFGDCAAEVILTLGNQTDRESLTRSLYRELGYPAISDNALKQVDLAITSIATQGMRMIWLVDRCSEPVARFARNMLERHQNLAIVMTVTAREHQRLVAALGTVEMCVDLPPMAVSETVDYVGYCLEHAGGNRRLVTDPAAIRLHEITGGAIADIAAMAESALALAASHRMDRVTPAFIEATAESRRAA